MTTRRSTTDRPRGKGAGRTIRYAVVGLGHIVQAAVLPAFANAKRNSELAALVSSDPTKLRTLGKRYGVTHLYSYDRFEECLKAAEIDAVYIGLPNSMHREYTERAARCGVHVLCEKPLGVTEADCAAMIDTCHHEGVKLMTAYRLHFEAGNLSAVKIARSGKLGELRLFSSLFTMQIKDADNIRVRADMGGGPLYDIGIYCINAARMLFNAEPHEVVARAVRGTDPRFDEVAEMVSVIMRYPEDRLATFTASFGAADNSSYDLVGTKGTLHMEPAYEYAKGLAHRVTIKGRSTTKRFGKRDQFAPELLYFSQCIMADRWPEPSGVEGLADVRIIQALRRSMDQNRIVTIDGIPRDAPASPRQRIDRPPVRKPRLVKVASASA